VGRSGRDDRSTARRHLGIVLLAPSGPGTVGGVPVAAALPVVVIVAGTVEIARTLYWAMCRRRLFRRAADAEDGLVPDAIVAHTSDAIVVNLSRIVARPPVFAADVGERHLRPVRDRQPAHPGDEFDDPAATDEVDDPAATDEVDDTAAGVRPARRGRAGRPTSGRGRRRA
jgi:hypothetical protein